MRDDGAEDSGDVPRGESDHELFGFGALVTWLGHDVGVQRLHSLLEAGELHHGVGDLAHPQRFEPAEEGARSLLGLHPGETITKGGRIVRSLNSDLEREF